MKTYIKESFIAIAVCIVIFVFTVWMVGRALDRVIDNQNEMLCNSAKQSGNMEWQLACKTYYENGDVKYLRVK